MGLQRYIKKRFSAESLELLDTINGIIDEYVAQGYTLTVRQLYYQLVARNVIPNTVQSYGRITGLVGDGRMAGVVDWDAIEDRTREFVRRTRWTSARDIMEAAATSFHMDMWVGQDTRCFVIVEKEALAGVLEPICRTWDVPLLAARGYPSVSVLREFAVSDLVPTFIQGQRVLILHLGDHDPSGIDMTRDLFDRLALFTAHGVILEGRKLGKTDITPKAFSTQFDVRRIALNMDQIDRYQPPPNPAKATDSRFQGYAVKYGDESWELDALEPRVLSALIEKHVRAEVDKPKWHQRFGEVAMQQAAIRKAAGQVPKGTPKIKSRR